MRQMFPVPGKIINKPWVRMVSTKHCLMTVKLASVEGLYQLTLMFSENPRAQFKKRLAMFFEAFVVFEETAASSLVLIKLLNVFI